MNLSVAPPLGREIDPLSSATGASTQGSLRRSKNRPSSTPLSTAIFSLSTLFTHALLQSWYELMSATSATVFANTPESQFLIEVIFLSRRTTTAHHHS